MIEAHSVSPTGQVTMDSSISLQYMLDPVPLHTYLFIFIIVAPPAVHETPSGQYMVAEDGQY